MNNERNELVIPGREPNPSVNKYLTYRVKKNEERWGYTHDTAACFSGIKQDYTDVKIVLHLGIKPKNPYTKEDMEKWVRFMNLCSFPVSLEKPYCNKVEATLEIPRAAYQNTTHFWIGITAIRYPVYSYSFAFHDIPTIATTLYAALPELDAYGALLMAHYAINDYYDEGHGVTYTDRFAIVTADHMLKKAAASKTVHCNDNCTDRIPNCIKKQVAPLIQQKKFQEAFDLLKQNNAII